MKSNAYIQGYNRVTKLAGLEPGYQTSNTVSGMAAGGTLGHRLGERLAKKTRKSILGFDIPGTESIDPGTASALGMTVGALGGGYLGHRSGAQSEPQPDTHRQMLLQQALRQRYGG